MEYMLPHNRHLKHLTQRPQNMAATQADHTQAQEKHSFEETIGLNLIVKLHLCSPQKETMTEYIV